MLGYVIALVCLSGWYMACQNINDEDHKKFLVGAAVLMTLFYGLRGPDTGSDTYSYIYMFEQDAAQPISELWSYMWKKKSPAYVLCEWIFYKFLPVPQLWLLATSAFFFFVFSWFLYKNSMDPFYSYFLFFTIFGLFQMTGIRQSCAMAVLLFAFEQMKKKKLFKYLLLIGLAYLFHKSAVVFAIFYFVGNRRVKKTDIPIIVVLLVLIYPNRAFLFDYIKSFTSYDYFDQLNHGEPINFSIMIYAATLLSIILCIFMVTKKRKQITKRNEIEKKALQREYVDPTEKGVKKILSKKQITDEIYSDKDIILYSQYANAMILASLFMPLVAINGAVRRIVMYFALFMCLFIPKAFAEILKPNDRFLSKCALGGLLLYLMLRGMGSSSYAYTFFLM